LAGAGLAVILFGARSGARVRAVAEPPAAPIATVDPEAQRAQQEAWRNAVAAPQGAPQAAAAPEPTSALESRDKAVARVKASGPAETDSLERARALGAGWAALAKTLAPGTKVGPWECHAAGCFSTIVHPSPKDVATLTNAMSREDEFRQWKGQKMHSGPIRRPDGATEVTWFLYTGDDRPRTE